MCEFFFAPSIAEVFEYAKLTRSLNIAVGNTTCLLALNKETNFIYLILKYHSHTAVVCVTGTL